MKILPFLLILSSCASMGGNFANRQATPDIKSVDIYAYGFDNLSNKVVGTTAFNNEQQNVSVAPWSLNRSSQTYYKKILAANGISANLIESSVNDYAFLKSGKGEYKTSVDSEIKTFVKHLRPRLKSEYLMVISPQYFTMTRGGDAGPGIGLAEQSLFGMGKAVAYASISVTLYNAQTLEIVGRNNHYETSVSKFSFDDFKNRIPASDEDHFKAFHKELRANLAKSLTTTAKYFGWKMPVIQK